MKRRNFLQKAAAGSLLMGAGAFPLRAATDPAITKLTILHTNDVHSRIEPFPMDGGRNQGLGGASRRAALIENIRAKEEHILVLDSGDIFQGTPYFNLFGGELEFKLMSAMRYDAATIGNHDFDAGLEGLHEQLPHAKFPFICSNYDFSDTLMNGKTRPYQIFRKGPVKIGILGLGIELKGLVPESLYGNTQYLDPIESANYYANFLKNEEKCDFVICLSHLGYRYREEKVSDMVVAENTRNIDLILGGHTHTFLDEPTIVKNLDGRATYINQVGWAGIMLGRLEVYFERNTKDKCVTCKNLLVN